MLELADEALLTDTFPPTASANNKARLLRLGLAVTAFSSLERYVVSRFDKLLAKLQTSSIPFGAFSDELKAFISREAASGLLNRMSFLDATAKQAFFDAHIGRVSSYLQTPVAYTAFGFSPRGSNVGHEDIKKAIAALGIKDPWGKLKAIATAIGSSRVSLVDDYKNMGRTRHSSAHDPTGNIPTADLKTHIESAVLIGIAIDMLTSSLGDAYIDAKSAGDLSNRIGSISYPIRFLELNVGGSVAERKTIGGRTIKLYPDEASAVVGARARTTLNAYIIVRSAAGRLLALA